MERKNLAAPQSLPLPSRVEGLARSPLTPIGKISVQACCCSTASCTSLPERTKISAHGTAGSWRTTPQPFIRRVPGAQHRTESGAAFGVPEPVSPPMFLTQRDIRSDAFSHLPETEHTTPSLPITPIPWTTAIP